MPLSPPGEGSLPSQAAVLQPRPSTAPRGVAQILCILRRVQPTLPLWALSRPALARLGEATTIDRGGQAGSTLIHLGLIVPYKPELVLS